MKTLDLIKTANGNLFRSPLRTILTLLAVFVGAFTLALTLGLGEGTKDYINKQTNTLSVENALIVQAKANSGFNPLSVISEVTEYNPNATNFGVTLLRDADIEKIKKVENIEKVYPSYRVAAEYIQGKENNKKYTIQLSQLFNELKPALASGSLPSSNENDTILISEKYAKAFGYSNNEIIGKKVPITFKDTAGAFKTLDFTVKGVLVNTLISGGTSYISVARSVEIYNLQGSPNQPKDRYFAAFAVTKSGLNAQQILDTKQALSKVGYSGQTYEDQIAIIKGFITGIQVALAFFAGISVLAATFGIINTLFMSVYERTREIGLMKALGMRSGGVFGMFAIEALAIGFWGGVIGLVLAYLTGLVANNYTANGFLKDYPGFDLFIFPWWSLATILVGTMIIGLLAGTLPAIKAARLDPIEALRYE